ncbi:signal transduction histidine kinase [Streptosporangium becharense]|uniref:Signal transduction histidine-protein kinase/phosphatase MprB n=1 Tax=Streptosporangium becharense TaxID=1816182 RepID=A0A7W9IES6_9ACTN|nr:ATP-binding protein [Streptosporangium becharense]MBB2909654.1 signal transduction histidine kinase [Streptosporangium becharense]MBB5819390.1 signal transduction histidine kinase [Streptosporangium becharense]
MRRRLLSSTLLVAVIAVLLLGIPLGVAVDRLIEEEATQELSSQAKNLLQEVEYARIKDQPIDDQQLEQKYPDRYIQIYARGTPDQLITVGTAPAESQKMTEDALSESGVYIVVSRDKTEVEHEVRAWLLLILGLAAAALAVAVGLAIVQSRRLTLPLRDLAMIAERLGSGDARPSKHRYGIHELDRVAEVLDRSATRISDLLSREREFATDASHQLRTPLTGLTMRLEEIVAAAHEPAIVKEEGEAAIVQAERLTAVIDELLAAARRQRHAQAEVIELDALLDQQFIEWGPAFRRVGRKLKLAGTRELQALGTSGGISQVVSTLLENSLEHGGGTVTVTTSDKDRSIVIEVADQGPGIPDELAPRVFERNVSGRGGTGLGLPLARALAAADGGRLELVRPRPAAFAFFLRQVGDSGRNRVVSGPA